MRIEDKQRVAMRNEPPRRPTLDLDRRIRETVLRILIQAALDAHGRDRMEEAWEDFRQT